MGTPVQDWEDITVGGVVPARWWGVGVPGDGQQAAAAAAVQLDGAVAELVGLDLTGWAGGAADAAHARIQAAQEAGRAAAEAVDQAVAALAEQAGAVREAVLASAGLT